jgi:hypothetical protein
MEELTKDLSKKNFIGKVIYSDDPTKTGRCKVRVFGLMDELPDEFIPWFTPIQSGNFSSSYGSGVLSVPKVGAYVRVQFANEDIMSGEYTAIQNVDPFVLEKIDKDDYQGTHIICADTDEELLVVFQPHSGLTMNYRDTVINISPTNVIKMRVPNENSSITLDNDKINITSKGEINVTAADVVNISCDTANIESNYVNIGKNAKVPAVNGTALVEVLTSLASQIQQKYPVDFGVPNVNGFSQILSNTVKISV